MKFIMLIYVKMPTIVGIVTFISRINKSESFKARNIFSQLFSFFKAVEISRSVNLSIIFFYNLRAWPM